MQRPSSPSTLPLLLSLPPEILTRIIALLPADSLPPASLVCTAFARIARAAGELYRVELARAGMLDGWDGVQARRCALPYRREETEAEFEVVGWTMPESVDPDDALEKYEQGVAINHDVNVDHPPGVDGDGHLRGRRLMMNAYSTREDHEWSVNACDRPAPDGRTDAWRAELEAVWARVVVDRDLYGEVCREAELRDNTAPDEEDAGSLRSTLDERCETWARRQAMAVKRQRHARAVFSGLPSGAAQRAVGSGLEDDREQTAAAGPTERVRARRIAPTPADKLDMLVKRRTAWEHLAPRPAFQAKHEATHSAPPDFDMDDSANPQGPAAAAEVAAAAADPSRRGENGDAVASRPAYAISNAFKFTLTGETSIYECQDGIFLYTDNYTSRGQRRSPQNIRLYPLPTADEAFAKHDVPTGSRYAGIPGGIADLTLDPQQDLLVVAENDPPEGPYGRPMHRYHFLTLSTLEPHPLAARPTFDSPMWHTPVDITAQLIQILGDIIGVLCTAYDPQGEILEKLFIWNWRTGEPLAYRSIRNLPQASGFVLLSPTHFLLVETHENGSRAEPVIRVMHTVSARTPTIPVEAMWDYYESGSYILFDADRATYPFVPRPIGLLAFSLPIFAEHTQTATVGIRPDPPSPPMHQATPFAAHKPFLEDYREGILVFELRGIAVDSATGAGVETFKGNMFVPRSFFVDAAMQSAPQLTTELREQVRVPWDAWGPLNSRILPDQSSTSRQWVVNSSGWRFVTTTRGTPRSVQNAFIVPPRLGPHRIKLLDFSPVAIRRFRHDHPEEAAAIAEHRQGVTTESGATVRLRDHSNMLPRSRIFEAAVETQLPYLELTSGEEYPCDGVMMDEQRILLTRAQISAAGQLEQEVTVLTF